jgi:(1->4)-alpha-D-glucan 1-alpha-D-glucosylmutase
VPDVYQGNELWDLHLVDPDNRVPVDFDARLSLLASLQPAFDMAASNDAALARFIADLLETWPDGRIKLWLTARLLRLRRQNPQWFLGGSYIPLHVEGPRWTRVVAYARYHEGRCLITVVPRLVANLLHAEHGWPVSDVVWQNTVLRIPDAFATGDLRNVITGESSTIVRSADGAVLTVGNVLRTSPIAVLVSA